MIHLIRILKPFGPNPTLLRIKFQSQTTPQLLQLPAPVPAQSDQMVSSSLSTSANASVCVTVQGETERGQCCGGGNGRRPLPFILCLLPNTNAGIARELALRNR